MSSYKVYLYVLCIVYTFALGEPAKDQYDMF
jgi:hypothetical protein